MAEAEVTTVGVDSIDADFMDKALKMRFPKKLVVETLRRTARNGTVDYELAATALLDIAKRSGVHELNRESAPPRTDAHAHMASAASRKAAGKRASADLEDQSKATKHLAPKPKARTTVPGSSLKALVDAGILAPGPHVSVSIKLSGRTIAATGRLDANGNLVDDRDDTHFDSPSGWGMHCIKKSGITGKCNGWKSVFYKTETLDSFRSKLA